MTGDDGERGDDERRVRRYPVPEHPLTGRDPAEIPATDGVERAFPGVTAVGYRLSLSPRDRPVDLGLDWEWRRLHERWHGTSPAAVRSHERVAAYADCYRRAGLDPEEAPPSVAALIERFLLDAEQGTWPSIHPVVDAVNVAAVASLVPLGALDADAVAGDLRLALTDDGESFQPLGAPAPTTLPADTVVFRDDAGVVSRFGHRDAERTKVTPETDTVWLLGCRVPGVDRSTVTAGLGRALALLDRGYALDVA